ncbi:MAG TPA: BstXI family restriction endonuclease [Bryobacteraceae bacterium]|nr:BstXI family restriction endonuclease [Bryobacteraceae bacterium]
MHRKIYKTGQTRGADDDEIYQNRVSRASTVVIPYPVWTQHFTPTQAEQMFEKGYIVLVSPTDYFGHLQNGTELAKRRLELGRNALVFYETRVDWAANNPTTLRWQPAKSRLNPLRGQYVARISATTAVDHGAKIIRGFETTANKGAGIRVYEYGSETAIAQCRLQLEALFWLCNDSSAVVAANGMKEADAARRKSEVLRSCETSGLLDRDRLTKARILNRHGRTTCPLCLMELSGQEFFNRMEQAAGREVLDLTITQVNLFHIEELRPGVFNHRPYNLGWGHHHCNVVVKDAGIGKTLEWLHNVLQRNIDEGHFPAAEKSGN